MAFLGDVSFRHASNGKEDRPCFALLLGYSFGTDLSDDLAALVSRELARRFRVTRIGADSVGWYPDKDWASKNLQNPTSRYGSFPSWVEWVKAWKPEWSYNVHPDDRGEALVFLRDLEKFVIELFESLDRAAVDEHKKEST